jgi:hypothetical protein
VTVLTGSYGNNFGEKFEPKGEMMKPGSLFVLHPIRVHGRPVFYVHSSEEGKKGCEFR